MGPPGSCRPQMGPMLAPWTLLSGIGSHGGLKPKTQQASIWFDNNLVYRRLYACISRHQRVDRCVQHRWLTFALFIDDVEVKLSMASATLALVVPLAAFAILISRFAICCKIFEMVITNRGMFRIVNSSAVTIMLRLYEWITNQEIHRNKDVNDSPKPFSWRRY